MKQPRRCHPRSLAACAVVIAIVRRCWCHVMEVCHVPTPTQCEASSSSITNRRPPEPHRWPHVKDEHHVPTPAQCEASSSAIANHCPPQRRRAQRKVVACGFYVVPNLGGALPSSSTTQARIPPPPVARLWATSTSYRLSVPAGGARQFPGPRLVASFDVVSAEIPPHRAPVLAHPSPTRRRDATAHVLRRGVR